MTNFEPTVIFIGCGKKKRRFPCPASDMYIGSWFFTCQKYALGFGFPIFILSAKYGVLGFEDLIHPYDVSLKSFTKKKKERWYERIERQIEKRNMSNYLKYYVAGKEYGLALKNGVSLLPEGGMGKKLKFMKIEIERKKNESIGFIFGGT